MSSSNFIRWCALAAIVGGVVYASLGLLGLLVRYLYSPSSELDIPPVSRYIESIFLFLLLVGVMAAIAALHTLQRERYGLLGMLAALIAFVGVALILVGAVMETLVGPAFGPSLLFLIPGLSIATVGLLTLGSATIGTRALPWWVGALIILGSPPFVLYLPSAFEILLPYEMLHPLLVGAAWALVGYALLARARIGQAQ
jgi:hypothetical protein